MRIRSVIAVSFSVAMAMACKGKENSVSDTDSMAQQIGDAMASVDDSGGSDGGYALLGRENRFISRIAGGPSYLDGFLQNLVPQAHATSCRLTSTWGSCLNNVIVRDFQNCTLEGATFAGTVTYTYVDAAVNSTCSVTANGHSVSRNPNFTITGPNGGTFTVSKTATTGQTIALGASNFTFANDGIRRVLTFGGATLADYTTSTTAPISISGAVRNGRVASGGALRVLNNLTSVSCDFAPTAVTWGSTCNCATSGSWSATCSNGASASFVITGCGIGNFTMAGTTEAVSLDQCSSL